MRRAVVAGAIVVLLALGVLGSVTVAAQTSSTFPQPTAEATAEGSGPESTSAELRTAQVGLIVVAVLGAAMVVAYWRHTGREARLRFASGGGRTRHDHTTLDAVPSSDTPGDRDVADEDARSVTIPVVSPDETSERARREAGSGDDVVEEVVDDR